MRQRFEEPSWNNPVVRIMDPSGESLVPRLANDWRRATLLETMVRGLKKAKRPVPLYLSRFALEESGHRDGVETAIFGMS
ncbi:MAG: hypothetical protein AAF488_02590 [Planctomycetota bacterium]